MPLTFNIVYTPGTVAYLIPFLASLLRWSDCRFRLVSNGCLLPERRLLQQVSAADERLSCYTMPTNGMADHGTVLNYLQAMTTDRYFCFMDSDLFATGDFLSELMPLLRGRAAVFSGAPAWMTFAQGILPSHFVTVSGVHHQTDRGTCLGSSYFAIYDNRALTDCLQATGIGFQTCRWGELPGQIRQSFASLGWQKQGFDTGKVLNLLLQLRGQDLQYADSERLRHIGGFSFLSQDNSNLRGWKQRLSERLVNSPLGPLTEQVRQRWRTHLALRNAEGLSLEEYLAIRQRRVGQRDPTRHYFRQLLRALAVGQPWPDLPVTGVAEVDSRIALLTEQLQMLSEQHRGTQGHHAA